MKRKRPYFFFYLIFTVLCLALVHWAFIFFMATTSVETEGLFIGEFITSNQMHSPTGRGSLAMGRTHRTSTVITRELQYRYTVNGKSFQNSRISNFLIFPNPVIEDDNIIKVYYNRFFNGYSVLTKLDLKYFIFNLIPQVILFIIMLSIKRAYMKEAKFADLTKLYFKSLTGSTKPNGELKAPR